MDDLLPIAVALLAGVVAVDQAWSGPDRSVPLLLGALVAFIVALVVFYRRRFGRPRD